MNKIKFLREGLKNLKTVGTLTRSSKYLCKGLVKHIDFKTRKYIVELGAGDGVITEHILKRMRPDAKLLTFEVNEKFCDQIRKIKDDRMVVIEDSAENLDHYLEKHDFPYVDAVISAIPFAVIPDDLSYTIIEKCRDNMVDGSHYVQVHYSLVTKKMYERIFGNVDVNFVPLNIPPAFALVSTKDPDYTTTKR